MVRQRESVGMSGGHQRPHAFVRIRAGVCRPVRSCARVELRMLRTGAGQNEDMEALFATQLRAFGDVTGRPLAGTSGRRHLGGHDSWPPLDAAQWIWLAASQSRRPHRAVSSQFAAGFLVGIPIALATQRALITR